MTFSYASSPTLPPLIFEIEIPDERSRLIALHTAINELSDAHYATLKYLMCHLYK